MNHLKKPISLFCILMLSLLMACQNSKQLAYFQDLKDTANLQKVKLYNYEPLKLQQNDQVQVTISSQSAEASQYFNLMTATPTSSIAGVTTQPIQNFANVYTVSPTGYITLPILGDIPSIGLTTQELKVKISSLLGEYLKDAVVSVRLINFKVTVIGDVTRPLVVPVQGEQINLLEALGAAGDMTVFGKRYNVKVIRKNGDSMEIAHINFNTSKAIQSPYFQLKQNDVVYVEPNKNKGFLGESFNIWVPVILSALSLITITIINILRFR